MDVRLGVKPFTGYALFVLVVLSMTACTSVSSIKRQFAEDLSTTILSHDDPATIEQAIPAYLVLIDSMIRGDQENIGLLMSGSKLYGAYASAFVDKSTRKITLSKRAFDYADRALCLRKPVACDVKTMSYSQYGHLLKQFEKVDAVVLFTYGAAWAGLVQANSADWNAVAELPKVKATMQRVLELDEAISNGDALVYMGVMESLLPSSAGGKPELAKNHFERALEVSNQTNLMAKLLYAEKYARLIFNRDLHDRLLNEVIAADVEQSNTRLIDIIVKARAKKLLAESDEYF